MLGEAKPARLKASKLLLHTLRYALCYCLCAYTRMCVYVYSYAVYIVLV